MEVPFNEAKPCRIGTFTTNENLGCTNAKHSLLFSINIHLCVVWSGGKHAINNVYQVEFMASTTSRENARLKVLKCTFKGIKKHATG